MPSRANVGHMGVVRSVLQGTAALFPGAAAPQHVAIRARHQGADTAPVLTGESPPSAGAPIPSGVGRLHFGPLLLGCQTEMGKQTTMISNEAVTPSPPLRWADTPGGDGD